jgi:anaerobic magnesium-protoporphyrin IX monomethyl ester cyclase
MKVVLLCVPIMDNLSGGELVPIAQDFTPSCPSLAIYLLAAILRQHGYEVKVIDLTAEKTNKINRWLAAIQEARLVGISATSLNWPTVLNVVGQIRTAGIQAPIVIGGVHPTMFSDYILHRYPTIDFVIRHEGEKALIMLCRALEGQFEYKDVPNLSWRSKEGQVFHNPSASLLTAEELASLPVPAYDLLPERIYPTLALQSSRGCAFCCSFCSTPYRRSYRSLPPSAFVDMVEEVQLLAGDRVASKELIQVVDDEWSLDRKRTIAILREINRRDIPVRFIYDSRANDFLDEEYAEAVAPYTERFLVGAECGYNEGLARIGKGTTVEKLEACARTLVKYNIAHRSEFSFILGLPWESKEDVLKTVRFASRLVLHYGVNVLLQWYCQIPGSLLWNESWRKGEVTPAMYDEFGFFRNLYLFKSGVHLSPEEIWEVMDIIYTTHSLIALTGRAKEAMLYRPPAPIELNYPREAISSLEGSARPLIWAPEVREKALKSTGQ